MRSTRHLTILFSALASLASLAGLASFATGCSGVSGSNGSSGEQPGSPASSSGGATPTPGAGTGSITWCQTSLERTGAVAGTSLDYPSNPDTFWFNTSLEEVALSAVDVATMREAGLSPEDQADVSRFRYFTHGFDLRWILRDPPTTDNLFGTHDFGVYVFDLADTKTAPDTAVAVFDASAVRDARLSGDRAKLASAIRVTVDAMKADPRPKAIVAFAPNRVPETSEERLFINLFARDVYFATTGSATLSNLRDRTGAPIPTLVYPVRNARTLDVKVQGNLGGAPFIANGSCLDLQISG